MRIVCAVFFRFAFGEHSFLHCSTLPSSGISWNLIMCSRCAVNIFAVVTDLISYTGIGSSTFLCTIYISCSHLSSILFHVITFFRSTGSPGCSIMDVLFLTHLPNIFSFLTALLPAVHTSFSWRPFSYQ